MSKARILFRRNWILFFILALALILRLWSLDFGLPFRYHVDEPAYVIASLQIARGDLQLLYPPLSPSLQELIYTALFAVLYLTYLARGLVADPQAFAELYRLDPTWFYLLARLVSALSSLLAILVLYRIVRRLRDETTALLAVFTLAVCFLDVRHAHFVEPYSLIALCALLCVDAAQVYISQGKVKWLVASGILWGIATGTRFSVASLYLAPVTALGLRWWSSGKPRRFKDLAVPLAWLALAGIAGLLIGVPGLVVNFRNNLSMVMGQISLASAEGGFRGLQFSDLPAWAFYGQLLEIAWGIPLLLGMLVGLGHNLWRHRPEDLIFAAFPLSFALVLLSASAASSAFARYLLPALPFLAYLAADGLAVSVGWLARRFSPRLAPALLILAALALAFVPARRAVQLDLLWSRTDTRTLAKAWIEANIPSGARLAAQWYSPPLARSGDPEPLSHQVYDLKILSPFSSDPAQFSLEAYRQRGFEYLVLSSFIYRLDFVDPALNAPRDGFLLSLERDAQRLAEFKPYKGENEPPFFFEQLWGPVTALSQLDRPGPVIKIYRIP